MQAAEAGTDKTETVEVFRAAVEELATGTFVGLDFVRKDGTPRRMSAKLGIADPTSEQVRNMARHGYLTVVDATATARSGEWQFRNVSVETVSRVRIAGRDLVG